MSFSKSSMKKYLAEFIGTFALVFCGTGSIIVDQEIGGVELVGIAAAFGIIITAMIYIFGSVSGAHINPAVTLSFWLGKKMPRGDVFPYIISQIAGAFLASGILLYLFPENENLGSTLPTAGIGASVIVEIIMTFFMMLTILGITARKEFSHLAGLVIGLTVTGIIFMAGPISGGSFNPARSIAPAILSGNISSLWLYLIFPSIGAIAAMLLWKFVFAEDD